MTDQDAIAAFLAKRAVTVCASGVAYGVDKEADKAKRAETRLNNKYKAMEKAYQSGVYFIKDKYVGEIRVNADQEAF